MTDQHYTLLVDCTDAKGLIYKITETLYINGLNIVRNDEFVSAEENYFFMRTEVTGNVVATDVVEQLRKVLPDAANIRLVKKERKKLVLMATKEHHCLSDLLVRTHFNELNAEVTAVISNYDSLQNLTEKFSIPFYCISHEGKTREEHEAEVLAKVHSFQPDYVVLAKYMRILTPGFVKGLEHKIINIHHSFLPAFVGANPYKQAYNRGVKIIGATAHFVNHELDEGPIIAQSIIPVNHQMDATDMARAGKDIEKLVLSNALRTVLDDKVFVNGNKTVVFE